MFGITEWRCEFQYCEIKDTIPIFRAEFGNFCKWPRDGHNEVNDIYAPYEKIGMVSLKQA